MRIAWRRNVGSSFSSIVADFVGACASHAPSGRTMLGYVHRAPSASPTLFYHPWSFAHHRDGLRLLVPRKPRPSMVRKPRDPCGDSRPAGSILVGIVHLRSPSSSYGVRCLRVWSPQGDYRGSFAAPAARSALSSRLLRLRRPIRGLISFGNAPL